MQPPPSSRPTRRKPPRHSAAGRGEELASSEFVASVERGFAVLKAFGADAPALTISQVAERAGFTRAVARRYLLTLESLGYLRHDGSLFALTPLVLSLGFTYLASISFVDIARPAMLRVVERLRESCSVGVLDRDDVVYVARVPADRIMTTNLVVGSRLPAHATAMGKVLLAYLTEAQLTDYFAHATLRPMTERTITQESRLREVLIEVRRQGWAGNDGESEIGVRTVAAPLVDRSGTIIAAINLSGHASRVSMRELKRDHLPVLLEAAREISQGVAAGTPTLPQGSHTLPSLRHS